MPDLKYKQLRYETGTWKRLLDFILEENIHLKTRLSEILKHGFDKNLLEEIEDFQNRFIKVDELMGLLRNDVAVVDNLLLRDEYENGNITKEIERKLKKLSSHIKNAERQFTKLKVAFNSFLNGLVS